MFSRQLTHRVVGKSAWTAFAAVAIMSSAASLRAQAAATGFESEPTLQYSSFDGLPPQVGSNYKVVTQVPVSGYYGQFTLHTEFGDLRVDGVSLLKQRIKEIQPTIELQKLSGSKVFADALGKSAQSGAEAVGRAVAHPVDTVKNVPAGIGRFFKSVGHAVESVASPSDNGGQGAAAMIVSATKTVSNLAWSLPPASVRELNDKDLAKLGVDEASRSMLLDNRWFTPTLALSFKV